MAYADFAPYVIFFHNRDEYNYAVAACGGTADGGALYNGSPRSAATFFGLPYPFPSGDMDNIDKGVYYNSGYFPGKELNLFAPPSVIMNDTDASFLVPGSPGGPSTQGTGTSRLIVWSGSIVYMKGAAPLDPLNITPIPQRRFFGGFELPGGSPCGEGFFSVSATNGCRDSSRSIDGLGGCYRPGNNLACLATLTNMGAGLASNKSWERFYFRIRRLPIGNFMFWRCNSQAFPAAGMGIQLTPTGTLNFVSISPTSVITVVGTYATVLTLNKWYKTDIFLKFNALTPFFLAQLNTITIYNTPSTDMVSTTNHAQSTLGQAFASDAQAEMDFDDWINADWPLNAGVLSLDSLDYLMGSHVKRPPNISGSAASYTPVNNWNVSNQGVSPDSQITSTLVSTTASALVSVGVDLPALGVQSNFGEVALGPVAMVVSAKTFNFTGSDGQLGYSIAGGAPVMATVNDQNFANWVKVLYNPSGLNEPAEIGPVSLRYTKSPDVQSLTFYAMQAIVEYIGIWGQEDVNDPTLFPEDIPRSNWIHNCRYANTPYGMIGPTLDSLVYSVGGTYTGNGTFQEITLPSACHMLLIRGTTVGARGIKFFGASIAGHYGATERPLPNAPLRMYYDSVTGLFKFSICGSDVECNQNAIVYQYIAFCDPGMRFSCCGAYNTPNSVTSRANLLQNDTFLPVFGFAQHDIIGSTSNTTALWSRGPGNLLDTGNPMDGTAPIATFGNFGVGVFNSATSLHNASNASQTNYMVFRTTEPNCGWIAIQCLSYVGNGAGSRVITLTPTSGRFPLFAMVIPTTGATSIYFRDPSHAGVNSSRFDNPGSTTTTAITAGGVDSITVGITLNANLIVYNVFVIPGSAASWANGTFFPPNCDSPDAFYTPVMDPPEIAVMGDGGLSLDGTIPIVLLKDVTGIYTLVPNKTNDTLYDRQTGQTSVDMKIPDPNFKTGYIGG